MSILKYFKNTSGRPPIGQQALSAIFFFKFATRALAKKKGACRPPNGQQGGLSPPSSDRWPPPTGATGGLSPPRAKGGVSPPLGRPGHTPLYKHPTPFPPHLSPKIPPKIQKNRDGGGEGKRRSPAGFRTCDLQVVHLVYVFFH